MKKKNHIACYSMMVGEMFAIIARATADAANGDNQRQIMREISPQLEKVIKGTRYYAELYFGCSAAEMQRYDPSLMAKAPSVDLLFDIGGNLMAIASREMESFCEYWNEESTMKIMVVEANLQIIEMMIEEVKSVH